MMELAGLKMIAQYQEQTLNQRLDNIEQWLERMAKEVRQIREGDDVALAEKVQLISNQILWGVANLGLDALITEVSRLEATQAKIEVLEKVQGR